MDKKEKGNQTLEALFAQADYYTLEEACEYLKLKYNLKSITTAHVFRYLEKYQIPLWVYYQDYNIHTTLVDEPKIRSYSRFKLIYQDMTFEGELWELEKESEDRGFSDLFFDAISDLEMSIKCGLLLQAIDWQNPNLRAGFSEVGTNCYYAATSRHYKENRERNIAFGKGFGISLMIDSLVIGEQELYSDKDLLILHDDLMNLIDLIKKNAPPHYYHENTGSELKRNNSKTEKLSSQETQKEMRANERKAVAKIIYALLKEGGYDLSATKGKTNEALSQLTKRHGVPVSRETISKWLQHVADVIPSK